MPWCSPAPASRCRRGSPTSARPGTGLWEKVDPMEVAHIDALRRDPGPLLELLRAALRVARRQAAQRAPTSRVAELERRGLVRGVITQNIDRLHRAAGSERLVEVHGSIESSVCLRVRRQAAARARGGDCCADTPAARRSAPPASPRSSPTWCCSASCCPSARWPRPRRWPLDADLMLCVGSSLEVYPVAGLPAMTHGRRRPAGDRHPGPDALRLRRRGQARRRRGGRAGGGAGGARPLGGQVACLFSRNRAVQSDSPQGVVFRRP